ncbi:MAG: CPBP family intramembrane glutamic endopeptidase [Terracidiphilus sp.]|jgi:membrane protease YdiL (CAAX protease family)
MTNLPEDPLREPILPPSSESSGPSDSAQQQAAPSPYGENSRAFEPPAPSFSYPPPTSPEPPLFHSYAQPPLRRFVRIPNFGHLLLLSLLITVAFSVLIIILGVASHFHLFGLRLSQKSATDLGFNLLSEAILYLVTFALSLFVFPMVWNESLFAGLQWRGTVALSKFGLLAATALGCFGLAGLDQILMPGPANAPIEKMISSPGAAWLMFAFGVTMAPFFEEMFFRGFILPSLCTTCDWVAEKMQHTLPRPLDAGGHPQWSLPAMIIGSIATSIPFALLHVEQQGHSLGPFLLLIVVSLILCAVRLKVKSLAASTLVHASYNFFIFSLTLAVTGGFRHFDKM